MIISVVILTKNEEKNITSCIQSLSFCDEIVVIDDYSTGKTKEIIQKLQKTYPIQLFERHLDGDFATQRNFGLEKAKGRWVLFIDADERVSEKLSEEILHAIKNPFCNGYFLKRVDHMWGKDFRFGETAALRFLRLGRKDEGVWKGAVHEVWRISGQKLELKNPLYHSPHPTLSEFLEEINYYTDLRAKELYSRKTKVSGLDILLYPTAKFFRNYIVKLGVLDGIGGLISAILMSFHSFLVRGKLWYLYDKNKQKS